MPELKPCPFCGGKAELIDENMILCEGDGISTHRMTPDQWNTRPEITDEDVERLVNRYADGLGAGHNYDDAMRAALKAYVKG